MQIKKSKGLFLKIQEVTFDDEKIKGEAGYIPGGGIYVKINDDYYISSWQAIVDEFLTFASNENKNNTGE